MILLIFPNPSPFPYHAMTPLAVFAVGTYLEERGIEVEYYDERVQSPAELEAALAQGPELLAFYAPLDRMISAGQRIVPLMEKPGNAPDTVHQSIYWPPNAFYMYRVIKGYGR